MLKVTQATFAEARFSVLSDIWIHECWSDLYMIPSPLDKQPAGYKSPHNWLVSLAMDLATLCDMWRCNDNSGCHVVVFNEDVAFARHFMLPTLPPPSHPVGVLVVLTIPKNYLKWQAIQLAIHSTVGA